MWAVSYRVLKLPSGVAALKLSYIYDATGKKLKRRVVDAMADHPNQIHLSPYAYGWNNATNLTDPDGNCPQCIIYATEVLTYVAAEALYQKIKR